MTYQVLARKYRPERFQEVVGQEHVTRTLLNAFSQDRIAHAYLFAGPRGIGKTTTARILAKALNCLTNSDGNPCNECQNCNEISGSRSMDVLEIDGASNRGIDEIRNLRELVKYAPIHSSYKVFIIDEVHMLTKEAFNALLKTLEEPPPHVEFIFATTEPNKVLPTIVSRCQRHDFHRISLDLIIKEMDMILEREGVSADDRTKRAIAQMGDGSMRDALSLLDQVIAFCGNEINFDEACKILGIIPSSLYFDIMETIAEKNRGELLAIIQRVYSQGYALSEFVSGLNQHLLNLLVTTAKSGDELLDVPSDMRERYVEESKNWDPRDLLRYVDQLTELETKLRIVQQPKVYVETVMLKLLEMDSSVTISDLISKLSQGGLSKSSARGRKGDKQNNLLLFSTADNRPRSEPAKQELEKPPLENSLRQEKGEKNELLGAIQSQWGNIVAKVLENGTSVGTFLSFGTPSEMRGKKLIVSFPWNYRFQMDVLKKHAIKVETAIQDEMDLSTKVDFLLRGQEQHILEEEKVEEHPVTKRMLELFGGKILG